MSSCSNHSQLGTGGHWFIYLVCVAEEHEWLLFFMTFPHSKKSISVLLFIVYLKALWWWWPPLSRGLFRKNTFVWEVKRSPAVNYSSEAALKSCCLKRVSGFSGLGLWANVQTVGISSYESLRSRWVQFDKWLYLDSWGWRDERVCGVCEEYLSKCWRHFSQEL